MIPVGAGVLARPTCTNQAHRQALQCRKPQSLEIKGLDLTWCLILEYGGLCHGFQPTLGRVDGNLEVEPLKRKNKCTGRKSAAVSNGEEV